MKNKVNISITRTTLILLGLYILFVFLSPILFSKISTLISFDSASGAIGDTIGGITAPFINLLAAILVYLSFKEQIKANEELNKENQFNYISHFIEMVTKDIENNNVIGRFNKTNSEYISEYLKCWKDPDRFVRIHIDGFAEYSTKNSNRYPQKKIEEIINQEVSQPLFALMGQTSAVLRLFQETHRIKLDKGITSFYLHRIASIVLSLRLDELQEIFKDERFLEKELLNQRNLINYTFCIANISKIEELGLMELVSIE